jgi:hypothetical protein
MEKCAYYLISYLEKNYKIQSDKLKFEINDPIQVKLSSGNLNDEKQCPMKNIDVRFSGSYIETGNDAIYQLSCILLTDMKKDYLLINKPVINELPGWIKKGYSLYVSSGQKDLIAAGNISELNKKKDSGLLKSPDNKNFNNAAISFFNFLDNKFIGKIPQFFREAYESGGAPDAFKKVYGKSEDELIAIWLETFQNEELIPDTGTDALNRNYIFNKDSFVSISPDGSAAGIIEKDRIKIIFLSDGSEKIVSMKSIFSQHGSLSWHPDSKAICIATVKNNQIFLSSIDIKTGGVSERISLPFQKISDMKIYSGGKYLFTGSSFESSDIFFYDMQSGKLTRITSDFFNKQSPVLIDENILLYFSNENSFENPFSSKYSLFMYDLKKKEKFKIFGNADSPSGITAFNKDRVAVSFKKNGINTIYSIDLKTAALKTAIQTGFDPSWASNGKEIFYFKNFSSGKFLKKKTFSSLEADALKEISKGINISSDEEKLFPAGEVIFSTD